MASWNNFSYSDFSDVAVDELRITQVRESAEVPGGGKDWTGAGRNRVVIHLLQLPYLSHTSQIGSAVTIMAATEVKHRNPLPRGPFGAIVIMYLTNSLSQTILFPFAAVMVQSFGVTDDPAKLG